MKQILLGDFPQTSVLFLIGITGWWSPVAWTLSVCVCVWRLEWPSTWIDHHLTTNQSPKALIAAVLFHCVVCCGQAEHGDGALSEGWECGSEAGRGKRCGNIHSQCSGGQSGRDGGTAGWRPDHEGTHEIFSNTQDTTSLQIHHQPEHLVWFVIS